MSRAILDGFEAHSEPRPSENVPYLVRRAKELAQRMGGGTPGAFHLLLALLGETRGTACQALGQCGVDAGRLRTAAMQLAQGIRSPRRTIEVPQASVEKPAPRGVVLPVVPWGEARPGQAQRQAGVAVPLSPVKSEAKERSESQRKRGVLVPLVPQVGPFLRGQAKRSAEPSEPSEPVNGESRDAALSFAAPGSSGRPSQDDPAKANPAGREPSGSHGGSPPDDAERRFGLDSRRFPVLTQLGKNLTLSAARGELDPVVGRAAEVEQTLDVLAKRQGNNPCLVGVAGVGKTSIARGVAQYIADAHDVASLDDRIIIEIPVGELVAGTGVRGALAGRLAAIRKEVARAGGRVVLFFDEIHQLFSGDAAEEIAGDLKLSLARGELPCIGATTLAEYRRFIEADSALARRFAVVEVEEPSREDAYLVLEGVARKLEGHHGVRYEEEALALGIAWSMRYLPGRALPDKAVSIVDLAGARVRRRGKQAVTPEAVAEVVAGLSGMPVERLLESDGDRMLRLEEILSDRVIGHGEHLGKIARILRRNAAGLGSKRPIGTFLLLGPTGVGKTETAKAIAEVLFHTESAMTRIDMSELSEAHAVAKLVGAPPGYVGHDAGGQLTEAVRRRPYQVVLLDEIEKAHPEVLTAFLAVFDEGRMTDGRGRTVDFTNTVIVLTSNLGAQEANAGGRRPVGFSAGDPEAERVSREARVVAAARKALPPELYNRIDEVLSFSALTRDDVRQIAGKLLDAVGAELNEQRGIRLDVEEVAIEFLLDSGGFDPELGARPMRRTLARLVEAPLAEKILQGEVGRGDVVLVSAGEDELSFDVLEGTYEAPAAE